MPRKNPPSVTAKPEALPDPEQLSVEELQSHLSNLQRVRTLRRAREDFLLFCQLMMPDVDFPEDFGRSGFEVARHHRAIAKALEGVESGRYPRLIVTLPPRHGKTQMISKFFGIWSLGRDPYQQVAFGTYGGEYAEDIGKDVRELLQSQRYRDIFPKVQLRPDAKSASSLKLTAGGAYRFVGRGGPLTGKGAHVLIIDDILKDAEEADSPTIREKAWQWFVKVAMTRLMKVGSKVIIVMCMTGDTRVRMADGSEKELRHVRPGDRVATYDNGQLSVSVVDRWRSNGLDTVYRIKTTSGITVKANARHPFLAMVGGEPRWTRLRDLRPGDAIFGVSGENGRARPAHGPAATSRLCAGGTAPITTTRSGGLTGFVLLHRTLRAAAVRASSIATGSRLSSTIEWLCSNVVGALSAVNIQGRTSALIGVESCASTIATSPALSAACFATTATSSSGMARAKRPCSLPQPTSDFTLDRIESIERVGTEEVFDVQIARTENFIANGLVSHNTRWHEDDLVGRLTNPQNPAYDRDIAKEWSILNLPAEAELDDPLGRVPGEALWPGRFPIEFLRSQKRLDPLGYAALYQQRPSPEEGAFFKNDEIVQYTLNERPKLETMRFYVASDHAVGADKKRHDASVFVVAGVCPKNHIWLVDCWWKRAPADIAVDAMLDIMDRWKPVVWWAEDGHITKSIGPFLLKRKLERGIGGCAIDTVHPAKSKEQRAQSIKGLMGLKRVMFPRAAAWFSQAKHEMLQFPNGANDDFVDALSLLGLRLMQIIGKAHVQEVRSPDHGTWAWWKREIAFQERQRSGDVGGIY